MLEVSAQGFKKSVRENITLQIQQTARIDVPTLTILGKYDPVIPPRQIEPTLRTMPQNQIVVMETGHAPFAEDPETFLGIVEPFLAQVVYDDVASNA